MFSDWSVRRGKKGGEGSGIEDIGFYVYRDPGLWPP